jgi:hypothetical protein
MINANEILFRCSSLGYIMTDGKNSGLTDLQAIELKNLSARPKLTVAQHEKVDKLTFKRDNKELSDTAITHCIDTFISWQYGRREELKNKFLDKGNEREEDALTLLSRVKKIIFNKNEEWLKNDFISGTPDTFFGKVVVNAEKTLDTKCAWSLHTFLRAIHKDVNPLYKWQGNGYMALTGAKEHTIAYCLVNGTENAITAEKNRLKWRMGIIDETQSEDYKKGCKQIEVNHIFDMKSFLDEYPHFEFHNDPIKWGRDIAKEERLHLVTFERNESEIEALYNRVKEARKWISENLIK